MSAGQQTTDVMKSAFHRLKLAEPEAFDLLVQSFDVYTIEIMQALSQAPQDQILNCQGRSQQCVAILRFMQECSLQRKPPAPAP